MMSLGYLTNGSSSSSSSSLSALAPPFTVDRSNKPNSNPRVHITGSPYAVPFHYPFNNWQYSHSSSSRPDLFSNLDLELGSIPTTGLPSISDYGYSSSHPVSSLSSHMPPLDPNANAGTDAFTFLQFSSCTPSVCVESKPYCPPLVSPVVDDAISLVALNEHSYDLLSNSCVTALGETSQVDYTRSLSGLEYTPPWGSFWYGLADGELGKQGEVDGSFYSEDTNDDGSYVYEKYMKQEACTADGSSKREEASAASRRKCVDVLGREIKIGSPITGKLNFRSSSLQDPTFILGASPKKSSSGTSSTLQESHAHIPSLESATSLRNHQIPYSPSYHELFQSPDSSINDRISVKKSSPALVFKPPNGKDHLDHISNAGKEFQLCVTNVPYGFTSALDSGEGFTSVRSSSENSDHYNPAVDSPCWKGAPSSHFSSSETSEAVPPQHPMKKSEACDSLHLQQTLISLPCSDDTVKVSCQNPCKTSVYHENGYVELGLLLCPERLSNANCPTGDHSSADAVKAGFNHTKLSSSNGVQLSSDVGEPRKECEVPYDSRSDSDLKPYSTKQPGLDKGEVISEREFKLCIDDADPGLNTNCASEDGNFPFHGVESTSHSHCSAENVNKLAKLHATESTPKMKAHLLVDTMHNLSKLLLFQCSNDASAVLEQDREALKRIIKNLDACVTKKIVPMAATQESMFTQQCISHECRNLPDLHEGVISGRLWATKEAGVSSHGQFDYHGRHEGKWNRNVSGKEIENSPDSVSSRDDRDIVKDDKMVQAIKESLKEEFNDEKEMQPKTLFYKNLWLEAEAALCSRRYKARFNRMKIEMKCKSINAEG
ncbi:hypothetical protein U1Q18_004900 [Sarracenia purpurea var. burkii]